MSGKKLWALKTVVLILSIYLGFWILVGLVFGGPGGSGTSALIEDTMDALVIFLLVRAAKRSDAMTLPEMAIAFQLPWGKNVSLSFLLGVTLWLGAGALSDLLRPVLPSWAILPEEYNFVAQFAKSHGIRKAILFFVVGFTTPVIEEVPGGGSFTLS